MQPSHEMNESLGTYLKRARAEKNVSIEQVAYSTRISLKMLRALEEDDHTSLPAPTFVRGYLQAYAKYVRLDTQDLLLRYQHHLATAPDAKRGAIRSHYLYVRERYQEKRRLVLVIVLFATMLSMAGAYSFLKAQREKHKRLAKTAEQIQKNDDLKPMIPPNIAAANFVTKETPKALEPIVPERSTQNVAKEIQPEKLPEAPEAVKPPKKQPIVSAPVEPVALPAPKPAPVLPPVSAPDTKITEANLPADAARPKATETKTYHLLLKANEDVWFRFQTDEDEVKDLTLRNGKVMTLRANKVIKIFSGNLGAIKATLNGSEIASLAGTKGIKSVVLPENEAANYKLPLFPQFQAKHAANKTNTERNQPPAETPPQSENPTVPALEP